MRVFQLFQLFGAYLRVTKCLITHQVKRIRCLMSRIIHLRTYVLYARVIVATDKLTSVPQDSQ